MSIDYVGYGQANFSLKELFDDIFGKLFQELILT